VLRRLPGVAAQGALDDLFAQAPDDASRLEILALQATRSDGSAAEARARVEEILAGEPEPAVALRALQVLVYRNPPPRAGDVLPILRPYLDAPDLGLRRATWRFLPYLRGGDRAVTDLLLRGMTSEDATVAITCVMGLSSRPRTAAKSLPALIARAADQAARTGRIDAWVTGAVTSLAPHWKGARKALDEAIAAAPAAARPALDQLRARALPR